MVRRPGVLLLVVVCGGSQCRLCAPAGSCSIAGFAQGYSCSERSCVGVRASCVGDYASSCSCGENPAAWQTGKCSAADGQGCAAEAARWCDSTPECQAFAINGGGYQGFKMECTPYGGLGGTMWGRCEPVPSPDWIAFEKLPPSRWGETTILLLLSLPLVYLGVGVAHAWVIQGKRGVGPELLPHLEQWRALGGLLQDGLGWSRARLAGRREYSPLPPSSMSVGGDGNSRGGDGGGRVGSGDSSKQTKEKTQRKEETKQKKQTKEKKEKKEKADNSETRPTKFLSQSSSAVASGSTRAGDGGRWVHIPG